MVVYSQSYAPSIQVLNHVKKMAATYPTIQLLAISSDDHRHLLGIPILNVTDVPSVLLFFRGAPFSSPVADIYQITDRLRRLSICSMEVDDFESIGTNVKVPPIPEFAKWRSASTLTDASPMLSILTPIYTVMDALYDI